MNNAIVALTRGYNNRRDYQWLIKRNQAIKKFFGDKYPIILFHEGTIRQQDHEYINQQSGLKCQFIDIKPVWVGGYESMCRFQTYWLWEYCKEYDYVLRIDEDCFLTKVEKDPFEMIGNNVYLKSVYWGESHSETNATLPIKINELTGVPPQAFYNNKFPYTNVGLSSVKYWRGPLMSELLKKIALCDEQLKNRWGDLPVLGSLLNIDAPDRVGTLEGMAYYHRSHNVEVICK